MDNRLLDPLPWFYARGLVPHLPLLVSRLPVVLWCPPMFSLRYCLQLLIYYLHWIVYGTSQCLGKVPWHRLRGSRSSLADRPQDPDSLTFKAGDVLKETYEIIGPIGRGGFGQAYKAINHDQLGHLCVLKEFTPQKRDNPEALAKAWTLFKREAEVLQRLSHPQIPRFHAFFSATFDHKPHWLLVQDWVEGETLGQWIQKAQFEEKDVQLFLQWILPVLDYLHQQGIYHRDIAPDNIVLGQNTKSPHLVDFGAVKQATASVIQASPTTVIYKKGYSPPEQYSGQVSAASDLYALGVTVIAMVTGTIDPACFCDSHSWAWSWRKAVKISVSPGLANIIDRMVQSDPRDRFASATEVQQALYHLGTTDPLNPQIYPPRHYPQPPSPQTPSPKIPSPKIPPPKTAPTVAVGSPPTRTTVQPAVTQPSHPPTAIPPTSYPRRPTLRSTITQRPSAPVPPVGLPFTGIQPLTQSATQSSSSPPLYSNPTPLVTVRGESEPVPQSRLSFVIWSIIAIATVLVVPLVVAFWIVRRLQG